MDRDDHDAGLGADLSRFEEIERRRFLVGAAGAVVVSLAACEEGGADEGGTPSMCAATPAETAGPFPGDGSNGPNALAQPGIVRADIRSSVGGAAGVAEGVELRLTLVLVDGDCVPLEGYAVYVWHCDATGRYSMYNDDLADENYLRGVQVTDVDGAVAFTTSFPGCYPGRWPHIHFEVFADLDAATAGDAPLATSQLALPEAACQSVYGSAGYDASAINLMGTSLQSDGVFRDGYDAQLADVESTENGGYAGRLDIALDA